MRPELDYLAALAGAYVAGSGSPMTPAEDLDWDYLLQLVLAHGVCTMLAPLVDGAPAQVRSELDLQHSNLRRRNSFLGLEAERVLAALAGAGIPCVALKGIGLAHTVYPRFGDRLMADLDILVRPDDIEDARQLLGKLGFSLAATDRHASFYREHHFHWILKNRASVTLELHWDLSMPGDYFSFDVDGFFERSERHMLGTSQALLPSNMDQLLHTACQAAHSGYADLRRIIDAALLLKLGAAEDPRLGDLARRQGMASTLWTLLHIQEGIVGIPVPPPLELQIRPKTLPRHCLEALDLEVQSLTRQAMQRGGYNKLLYWVCAPNPRALARQVNRYVFPGIAEMLDGGHDPFALPGLPARARVTLQRSWSLAKISGYQFWRLLRGGALALVS